MALCHRYGVETTGSLEWPNAWLWPLFRPSPVTFPTGLNESLV